MIPYTIAHRELHSSHSIIKFGAEIASAAGATGMVTEFYGISDGTSSSQPGRVFIAPYNGYLLSCKWKIDRALQQTVSIFRLADGSVNTNITEYNVGGSGTHSTTNRIVAAAAVTPDAYDMKDAMVDKAPIAITKGDSICVLFWGNQTTHDVEVDGVLTFKWTVQL